MRGRSGWQLACLLATLGAAPLLPLAAGGASSPRVGAAQPGAGAQRTQAAEEHFEERVRPVLAESCQKCHGESRQMGGLRLDSREALLRGGGRGPAVVPGNTGASLLLRALAGAHGMPRMPPSRPLPPEQIAALAAWVRAGAPWPAAEPAPDSAPLWSTRPLRRPAPPAVRQRARVFTPVDAFVLQQLEARGLSPAPPAGRRELLRRLTFDLTGLPPTPDDVAAFLADPRPDAYERVVDRLLASPHYGERWARHWLDLVRYADSNGYERDAEKPLSWKYRDYVIASLNADKPYHRFVVEQLAGDELPERSEETVAATGLLRVGTWDDEPNDPLQYRYERLDDLVNVTGAAFLGLTVKCARCHDHKFDPIPQRDYYALAAAFSPGYLEPGDGKLQGGPPPERLGFSVLGFTDRGPSAPPLRLLEKGDPRRPGEEVPPGYLSLLPQLQRAVLPPPPGAATTHRRLQLARWITDPRNPLTPRVLVNRLWQHHFGEGLVRTPNNFGRKGAPPTHPELLDWLASELLDGGWRLKRLHRLIVLSSTYRQSSLHPRENELARRDAGNLLLWKYPRRRLDADALRDAMLAVSGELNLESGGRGFLPTVSREALEGLSRKGAEWTPSAPEQQRRRTIYMFLKRALIPPFLTVFDFGDTTQPLEARGETVVPLQALALLNNRFPAERAEALAARAAREAGPGVEGQIRQLWRLALGRSPTPTEAVAAREHAARIAALPAEEFAPREPDQLPGLRLWLRADRGVRAGRSPADPTRLEVAFWADGSGRRLLATAPSRSAAPLYVADAGGGRPALRFDGRAAHLRLESALLTGQHFTLLAVARDAGAPSGEGPGHRELLSNWNGPAGNAGSSVFLGLTGAGTVRFTDAFAPAGVLGETKGPLVLTAVAAAEGAAVFRGQAELARLAAPLPPRNLEGPYLIGRQGAMDGEYWHGDLHELVVFDRALSDGERAAVTEALLRRYGLATPRTPAHRALTSLAHVLFNTNEFVFLD